MAEMGAANWQSLAAIRVRNEVAWDVGGLPAISVEFLATSRVDWVVFEMRNVSGCKITDPRSSPTKGKLGGY